MTMMLALALATGSEFYPSAYLTAKDLQTRCQSSEPASASYCFAYIVGVYDTVVAYEAWLNLREFCVPFRTPQADLRRAFLDYISANPDKAGGVAASVVVVSLKQAYRCPSK